MDTIQLGTLHFGIFFFLKEQQRKKNVQLDLKTPIAQFSKQERTG